MSTTSSASSRGSRANRDSIRKLSQDLEELRKNDANPSPRFGNTLSSLSFNQESVIESTRLLDETNSQQLPRMRSTAQRFRFYNAAEPQPRITTSAVKRERFHGFDQDLSEENSDESESVELGRGHKRSANDTPSRMEYSDASPRGIANMGNDSILELTTTPPTRRSATHKSDVGRAESLRKESQRKQIASRDFQPIASRMARVSPAKSNTSENRRLQDAREQLPPPTATTARSTRFTAARAGQSPLSDSAILGKRKTGQDYASKTSQPERPTTPRGTTNALGLTHQSFMLPDLPNLTELMSGVYKDGTPVFSRSSKSRTRFARASSTAEAFPHHAPIENVPVPEDEKAIFASLQLLKEKVAQLEQDKADADRRVEEFESEVIELRVQLEAQERSRRSDSALGSDDDSKGRKEMRTENTQLQASIQSLQNRLDATQRKLSVNEIALKRVTNERDNAITQIGVAFYHSEELKAEKEALQKENETLRSEVDALRAENVKLSGDNGDLRRRKNPKSDRAIASENDHLREELMKIRTQHEEDTRKIQMEEAQTLHRAEKKAQQEQEKLRHHNEDLKAQLQETRRQREKELRRWQIKETDLENRIQQLDETTQHLQATALTQTADDVRRENEKLKSMMQAEKQSQAENLRLRNPTESVLHKQLADVMAQHEEESLKWGRMEAKLKENIARLQSGKPNIKKQAANNVSQRTDEFMHLPTSYKHSSAARTGSSETRPASTHIARNSEYASMSGALTPQTRNDRRASAPVPSQVEGDEVDHESTTDLGLSEKRQQGNERKAGHSHSRRYSFGRPDLNETELSFMPEVEIARIREQVEKEYKADKAAERRAASLDAVPESRQKDATTSLTATSVRSAAERRSSSKNRPANTPRRRRSAPPELTSAFILPDITLRNVANSAAEPPLIDTELHNPKDCTVCHRVAVDSGVQNVPDVSIPKPTSVSELNKDDPDATMRPVLSPAHALAKVLKELQDEVTHKKMELSAMARMLESHDPRIQSRRRRTIQKRIDELNEEIRKSSVHIYDLMDVLEGQNSAERLNTEPNAGEQIEHEVEQTLMSIGMRPSEAKERATGGRKVVVRSVRDEESDSEASSEDLPWEGISDTASLRSFRSGISIRRF